MPPVNNGALASAGVIAVSVAVAAAIAIYESPEIRRYADDIRRRIAVALHSLGEGIEPEDRPPMFNRPEDAQGFLESRGGAEAGVDADDETRRRQREELLYWNAVHLAKKEKEKEKFEAGKSGSPERPPPGPARGRSFDDFMQQDYNGEKGSFVFNTGANVHNDEGLVCRRPEGVRGLNSSLYANPFADEHQIDQEELPTLQEPTHNSHRDEAASDIYSATTRDTDERLRDTAAVATLAYMPPLVDVAEAPSESEKSATLDRELGPDEYMTAGQENREEAYASIQAWAQGSSTASNFYSPLPMSPPVPMSEPELVSEGELTPTDSSSLAGSGEDVADEAASSRAGDNSRYYDVLSESEGMMTPASWYEVGSVVSETETQDAVHAGAHA
ncbi:hypothetical protein LZ32DRAFT_658339 [Colletotrichum eremochloae]|nr:hypothetical protein LZ32DRAFT_658339 [Colletotrichum eremochloae]